MLIGLSDQFDTVGNWEGERERERGECVSSSGEEWVCADVEGVYERVKLGFFLSGAHGVRITKCLNLLR